MSAFVNVFSITIGVCDTLCLILPRSDRDLALIPSQWQVVILLSSLDEISLVYNLSYGQKITLLLYQPCSLNSIPIHTVAHSCINRTHRSPKFLH